MENKAKLISKLIIGGLSGVVLFLAIMCFTLSSRFKTVNSALDNTTDSTIIEIDDHKKVIDQNNKSTDAELLKIENKCKKIARNMPQRFIDDGTCEIQ